MVATRWSDACRLATIACINNTAVIIGLGGFYMVSRFSFPEKGSTKANRPHCTRQGSLHLGGCLRRLPHRALFRERLGPALPLLLEPLHQQLVVLRCLCLFLRAATPTAETHVKRQQYRGRTQDRHRSASTAEITYASDIQGRMSRSSSQALARAKALERALRMFSEKQPCLETSSSAGPAALDLHETKTGSTDSICTTG